MAEVITSASNARIKLINKLHNRKKGDELVYIEGSRIVSDCLMSGGKCELLICAERRYDEALELASGYSVDESQICVIGDSLFGKISSTVNSQGIAMIAKSPVIRTGFPVRGGNDIYCVLDDVQDPGNVGTIIRMADAFNFTAVIVTRGTADPFGEKALRASMGSSWHIPVAEYADDVELVNELNSKGVTTLAMHLRGEPLFTTDINMPCAFFIGNEGNGLSDDVSSLCSSLVKIPMPGKAESLNAASAASVIGYELMRRACL